ncbi:MAG: hypothetical protein KKI08_26580 [Armatimonadetes bacterium]|nr:hypothetical protein [Armatimonadota bacterium]
MRLNEAGVIWTTPRTCAPLDEVQLVLQWRGLDGQPVTFQLTDAAHHVYLQQTVTAGKGRAELTVRPGGQPGVHLITATIPRPGEAPYMRHGSFRVQAETGIATDTGEMDELLELLAEGLRQTLDVTQVNGKLRTYYKAADNSRQNLAYPAFGIDGLRYFLADVKSMFEAVYDNQWPDGRLPDHVYGDNYPCARTPRKLRTCMADLEIGMATTLCKGWIAHGDDAWLREMMPAVEAGLEFATTDPMMFDEQHGVIKRPHTLDEWDIAFDEEGEHAYAETARKWVLMQGDTSQVCHACALLGEAFTSLGDPERADHYRRLHAYYRAQGNALFWDGVKYRPHIHLDPFDHGDFDEDNQLTMSNAAALNREFTTHAQAVSIIDEYVRRWEETGDAFPWWSLQPGYPDRLGYFRRNAGAWTRGEGEYCNGGLFPWVGGELCRAALRHGREELASRLLRDLLATMQRDHGALFTWYNADGSAAINAPHHQTNYDPWGLGPWATALVEELAGIQSQGKTLQRVLCAPRWPAVGVKQAAATAHFPASDKHFTYRYRRTRDRVHVLFGGTGEHVTFRIMLPGWDKCSRVTLNGKATKFRTETVEQSLYVTLEAEIKGVRELTLAR